jgi:GNAT superfamily N-acetyltransferase
MDFTVGDAMPPETMQFLDDAIYAFNVAATGHRDGRLLSIVIRDEAGEIAAGLYGWTWGGCAEVRYVWVRDDRRGQGWGRGMLAAAEAEAARRGCGQMVLSTHSFQAPDFYKRLGYEIAGRYDDYPRGHQQIFLRKQLKG